MSAAPYRTADLVCPFCRMMKLGTSDAHDGATCPLKEATRVLLRLLVKNGSRLQKGLTSDQAALLTKALLR